MLTQTQNKTNDRQSVMFQFALELVIPDWSVKNLHLTTTQNGTRHHVDRCRHLSKCPENSSPKASEITNNTPRQDRMELILELQLQTMIMPVVKRETMLSAMTWTAWTLPNLRGVDGVIFRLFSLGWRWRWSNNMTCLCNFRCTHLSASISGKEMEDVRRTERHTVHVKYS